MSQSLDPSMNVYKRNKDTFNSNNSSLRNSQVSEPSKENENRQNTKSSQKSTPNKIHQDELYLLSRTKLDADLSQYLTTMINESQEKDYFTLDADSLKEIFLTIVEANAKQVNHEITQQFASYKQRIEQLDTEKLAYENKIKSHADYISELETKVNKLIIEYEKTLNTNEELAGEIQVRKNDNPSPYKVKIENIENIDMLIENEQNLFEQNNMLKKEIKKASERAGVFEDKLKDLEKVNNDLRDANTHLNEQLLILSQQQTHITDSSGGALPIYINENGLPGTQQASKDNQGDQTKDNESPQAPIKLPEREIQQDTTKEGEQQIDSSNPQERAENEQIGDGNSLKNLKDQIIELKRNEESYIAQVDNLKSQLGYVEEIKSKDGNTSQLSYIDILHKQVQDYRTQSGILQKKLDKYDYQIEVLNETLAQTNESLDLAQNRCITLEKELSNKDKLQSLIKSHLGMITELEIKIQDLAGENQRLQKQNQDNMVLIEDLRSQLEDQQINFTEDGAKKLIDQNLLSPPSQSANKKNGFSLPQTPGMSSRITSERQLSPSGVRLSESQQLEIEFLKKENDDNIKKALRDKEIEIDMERVNHKNQIEKYNQNLEILSGKITALVIVNEKLSKEMEVIKMEFTNYRIIAWSVLQEMRKSLDNFRKYDEDITSQLKILCEKLEEGAKLQEVYNVMKEDILYVDRLIEDRRKLI